MVIGLLTILLVHLTLTFIGILMGKYIPNFVDKKDEKDVVAFFYWCIFPLSNIIVILIGISYLVDNKVHKFSKYLMRWL